MATRTDRSSERAASADQRRSGDRRTAIRAGAGRSRGRRATDDADARAGDSPAKSRGAPRKRRSTRDGREPLVIYLQPESIRALKMAALEADTTASAIMADVLAVWLRAQGRATRR